MSRSPSEHKPFTLQPYSESSGEYLSPSQQRTPYSEWPAFPQLKAPSVTSTKVPLSPPRISKGLAQTEINATYNLMLDLPYRETMALCNASPYNVAVCSNAQFWFDKAKKYFNVSPEEFQNPGGVPTILDPSQRYLEILSNTDDNVDIGSERFLPLDVCLTRAVKKNDSVLIQYFIAKGAHNWDDGAVASARQGNTELTDYFLDLGATNLNRILKGAIMADDLDLVMTLLEKGATDINGALFWSILANNSVMIDLFLERGADDMDTALIIASAMGNDDLVKLFIERKAIYLSDAANVAEEAGHHETASLIRGS